jgi:hypothetical protein
VRKGASAGQVRAKSRRRRRGQCAVANFAAAPIETENPATSHHNRSGGRPKNVVPGVLTLMKDSEDARERITALQ